MLLDDEKNELFIHHARGLNPSVKKDTRVRVGQGISGWVAEKGEGILVSNIDKNQRFRKEKKDKGFRNPSFICIPLKVHNKVFGVLNLHTKKEGGEIKKSLNNIKYLSQLLSSAF